MSDETIRALARQAGEGDLAAAKRLVMELERTGSEYDLQNAFLNLLEKEDPHLGRLFDALWSMGTTLKPGDVIDCRYVIRERDVIGECGVTHHGSVEEAEASESVERRRREANVRFLQPPASTRAIGGAPRPEDLWVPIGEYRHPSRPDDGLLLPARSPCPHGPDQDCPRCNPAHCPVCGAVPACTSDCR